MSRKSKKMLFINCWKAIEALVSLKNMTTHSKNL